MEMNRLWSDSASSHHQPCFRTHPIHLCKVFDKREKLTPDKGILHAGREEMMGNLS